MVKGSHATRCVRTPFGVPSGVQQDVTAKMLTDWTLSYDREYSHSTAREDLEVPEDAKWVFVGARAPDGGLAVGAFGPRDVVLRETPSGVADMACPSESNGVHWYLTAGKAFGFAPTAKIKLYNADMLAEQGYGRLSWHLTGNGGYRAGSKMNLNSSVEWRKQIYYR